MDSFYKGRVGLVHFLFKTFKQFINSLCVKYDNKNYILSNNFNLFSHPSLNFFGLKKRKFKWGGSISNSYLKCLTR